VGLAHTVDLLSRILMGVMRNFTVPGALTIMAVCFLAATAGAQTEHGITPLAPKAGATIKAGTRPTFRARVSAKDGAVWVYVCRSKVRDDDGVICRTSAFGRADRKADGRTVEYRPSPYGRAGAWLRTPGTYYWQVVRIDCQNSPNDCFQEGGVRRVVIR
jgi:hypothetical protein